MSGWPTRQTGGAKFWPLITVAIILILLLSYCSLRHRAGPTRGSGPRTVGHAGSPATSAKAAVAEITGAEKGAEGSRSHRAGPGHLASASAPVENYQSAAHGQALARPGLPREATIPAKPVHKKRRGPAKQNTPASAANVPCDASENAQAGTPAAKPSMVGAPGILSASSPLSTATAPFMQFLAVVVNGQPLNETDLFLCPSGKANGPLYAKGSDIRRWRLQLPHAKPYHWHGSAYYSLGAIPGLHYRVDQPTQTLYITVPANAFAGNVVDGFFSHGPKLQPTPWGGFFNYDLLGSYADHTTQINGLFEAGLFNNWGVGTSTFLDQNLGHAGSHLIRLDTAWRHDNPNDMTTLTIGDSITQGGLAALGVRFGGLQYGTNFSTRPYYITYPMPGLSGSAAVPSTVDLYVNGLLQTSQKVPAGPFSVPEVPIMTGPNQATLVVRNALGQQQAYTTSFYASTQLLKTGLNDYSFSVGKLRENFGTRSNDYRGFASTGLFRHGFNQHFTGEVYGELSSQVRDVSAGGSLADMGLGELTAAVSASNSALGTGELVRFGIQHKWKRLSVGADLRFASPKYTELGYNGLPAPHKQITATLGVSLNHAGSLYANYLDQESPLFGHVSLVSAGYYLDVGHGGFLSINAFRTLTGTPNNGVNVSFTIPLGERRTVSTGIDWSRYGTQGYAQLDKSLPPGSGTGYRVAAQIGQNAVNQAEFDYRSDFGTYRAGVLKTVGGSASYSAEASGGLAFIGGGVFPTRQVEQAFALAEVPGMPNVTIYSQNQPVATTDKAGYALIPQLLPYQDNPLRIGVQNLPLGAQVGTLHRDAVPRYRSGVIEKFPVTYTRGATLTIKLPGGKYLPSGAEVRIVGGSATFPVGLNGEVYLTGLSSHNIVEAKWGQQHCRFTVNMPDSKEPIPDLGTFFCSGIHL